MKAALITSPGGSPVYGDFPNPAPADGAALITVAAAALSHFSKSRSAGSHYSSTGAFPAVAGAEGVGRTADGRRVYFVLPEHPFGALAEQTLVRARQCVEIPDGLDDVTAAALANPGMSAWAALVERAHLAAGETVLVNGATGSAGRLAVQLAKHLGAGRVIATGRNESELQELLSLGADVVIPTTGPFEKAVSVAFAGGINVVVDYLWGETAKSLIIAIAKTVDEPIPVRFVHVGGASREENIELPGAALRSSAIQLMGSGVKSVPFGKLLDAIGSVFALAQSARLQIATQTVPLARIAEFWDAPGKPRIVVETA